MIADCSINWNAKSNASVVNSTEAISVDPIRTTGFDGFVIDVCAGLRRASPFGSLRMVTHSPSRCMDVPQCALCASGRTLLVGGDDRRCFYHPVVCSL